MGHLYLYCFIYKINKKLLCGKLVVGFILHMYCVGGYHHQNIKVYQILASFACFPGTLSLLSVKQWS